MLQRVLILGGTTESRQLAAQLTVSRSKLDIVLSLAGRTREPVPYPVPLRIGGFGGRARACDYLNERRDQPAHRCDPSVRDADVAACGAGGGRNQGAVLRAVPARLAASRRRSLDRCRFGCRCASGKLGKKPRRVFVTLGRQELAPLAARRTIPTSCAASTRSIRRSTFPTRATSSIAARSASPPSARCSPKTGSTLSLPRTAAATRPTPRSRRRAISASMSCWCAGQPPNGVETVESVAAALSLAAHRLPPVEKRGV